MRIGFFSGMLGGLCLISTLHAQEPDSLKAVSLSEVVVTESYQHLKNKNSTWRMEVVGKEFLREHFTGNLIQTLGTLPGVHSMDIGSGFSKPMIRGMGFNRISVVENGIKQEGQQWGADHGLELDAFNAGQVSIRKGPASLLYGSDAMGGAIELVPLPLPAGNRLFGEASLLGKSVNGTLGGSLMLGVKKMPGIPGQGIRNNTLGIIVFRRILLSTSPNVCLFITEGLKIQPVLREMSVGLPDLEKNGMSLLIG